MVNIILTKRVNYFMAKVSNPVCPKGSKLSGFSIRLERLKNILFAKYEKPPETISPDGFVIFSQGLPEGDLANRSEVDGGCRHSEGLEHPAHGREAYAVAFLQP